MTTTAIATASVKSSCSLTGSPPCRGQRIGAAFGGDAGRRGG
jgi:hypothetical protein